MGSMTLLRVGSVAPSGGGGFAAPFVAVNDGAVSQSNAGSQTFQVQNTCPAGSLVVLWLYELNATPTVTDTKGNTWSVQATTGPDLFGFGFAQFLATSVLSTALTSGTDTITTTFSGSNVSFAQGLCFPGGVGLQTISAANFNAAGTFDTHPIMTAPSAGATPFWQMAQLVTFHDTATSSGMSGWTKLMHTTFKNGSGSEMWLMPAGTGTSTKTTTTSINSGDATLTTSDNWYTSMFLVTSH